MPESEKDRRAIVYCEGSFNTTNGKTAHGLVRRTSRYEVVSVVDSRHAGQDAGTVLDGKPNHIPVVGSVRDAVSEGGSVRPTHLVVGLAPDGGRMPMGVKSDIRQAIEMHLNVDCGLHDYLSEDEELSFLARRYDVTIRDVRKPPPRSELHFFSGKIQKVRCPKIAVLGTDSALGKRTTAWMLVDGLQARSVRTELIGTGQTAWLQGAPYCVIVDALVNDFVAGEIEHTVHGCWEAIRPDCLIIEGQGCLLNPAYPGGFEILAAARPDVVVLQHAPRRKDYDGFFGWPIHPLKHHIEAIKVISDKDVVAIAVNHENLDRGEIEAVCEQIERETGVVAVDPLWQSVDPLVEKLLAVLDRWGPNDAGPRDAGPNDAGPSHRNGTSQGSVR